LDEPQAPLTGILSIGVAHCAAEPPLMPSHTQVQGPLPVTPAALPALQRLVAGALITAWPLDDPQAPLTGSVVALDELEPVELEPELELLLEELELVLVTPLLEPEPVPPPLLELDVAPELEELAAHCTVVPPKLPKQSHVHGPVPLSADATPTRQRLLVGACLRSAPLALPQAPFTWVSYAEQAAAAPPFGAEQLHNHGPEPLTDVAVPTAQRSDFGALLRNAPLALPQTPFLIADFELAVHSLVVPP
jgi:hypothetical protein